MALPPAVITIIWNFLVRYRLNKTTILFTHNFRSAHKNFLRPRHKQVHFYTDPSHMWLCLGQGDAIHTQQLSNGFTDQGQRMKIEHMQRETIKRNPNR
ncbi:unnamed protein product [Cuscuta campestris]|uniref:Uncharacterized protein n=1 Tax=Cuscuta campestris TaxID=132261 RepID=A0A484KE20_9ASTE|nr:unnamed protein product [Cuscuta campestris]